MIISYVRSARQQLPDVYRLLRRTSEQIGVHSSDMRVDETTLRIDCLTTTGPVLEPGSRPWMKGFIYDARPVRFLDQDLAFSCGQPSYNPEAGSVIGRAVWSGDTYIPDLMPCIYPTDETHGIDIPTFCVHHERVVGVYFDNYGPGRSGDCRSRDLIVCESDDGLAFTKRRLKIPLKDYPFANAALPWIESVDGEMFLTIRAKPRPRNILSRTSFDIETGQCLGWQHADMKRTTINVATITLDDRILAFYGHTTAGGVYVTVLDKERFEPVADAMAVDRSSDLWGWDMSKICPSPLLRDKSLILLYTTPNGIGKATLDDSIMDLELQ